MIFQVKADILLQMFIYMSKFFSKTIACLLCLVLSAGFVMPVFADEPSREDIIAERQALPIESNDYENWPEGPAVAAESACLMDVETGTILYAKNMDKKEFPASTTKVMTCLLAAETCSMNEIVTFSKEAVFGIERDSSNVGMDVGQSITMEEALYCIMLASANEVASAVAEHVGGTIDDFANMMNAKAKELGCKNTHFVNANGLHNEEHYTTAHDLALITAAYFNNEQLRKIASTTYYEIHATATQPDEFGMPNHHKMLPGKDYAYDYIVGGKTGYTNMARQTLASCAEKDGITLVCTVMRDEAPYQYTDTKDLFNYGFDNFQKISVAENEERYTIDNANFFHTDINIFGNSKTFFSIGTQDHIMIPITADFSDLDSELIYDDVAENELAQIQYTYHGLPVGLGRILMVNPNVKAFKFGTESLAGNEADMTEEDTAEEDTSEKDKKAPTNIIFVNYKPILIGAGAVVGALFMIFIIHALLKNFSFSRRRRRNISRRSRRYKSEFDDFDF